MTLKCIYKSQTLDQVPSLVPVLPLLHLPSPLHRLLYPPYLLYLLWTTLLRTLSLQNHLHPNRFIAFPANSPVSDRTMCLVTFRFTTGLLRTFWTMFITIHTILWTAKVTLRSTILILTFTTSQSQLVLVTQTVKVSNWCRGSRGCIRIVILHSSMMRPINTNSHL